MSARPRRPERYQIQPTSRLPGRPPVRGPGPSRYPHPPRRRRNHSCGAIVLGTLLLLLVFVLGGVYYVYNRFQSVADDIQFDPPIPTQPGETLPDIAQEPFNILLVGLDFRSADPAEGARSDTLIVVHVDPRNQWASMLSIPRDSYAYIPRKESYEKINAAYSYGFAHPEIYGPNVAPEVAGVTLASEAVEEFLNLRAHGTKIHHRAQIDFEGFKRIVDAIGGINIDVPKPLIDPQYPTDDGDNGYIRLYIPAGLQHMDGTTALRYARSRHQDADFGRSQRQQQVLRAILHAMKERGLIDQIIAGDAILEELRTAVSTDLPISDLSSLRALARLASAISGDRLVSYTINPDVVSISQQNGSTIIWNEVDLSRLVDQWLRGPAEIEKTTEEQIGTEETHIQVFNGARIPGLAGEVTAYLAGRGFTMLDAANADRLYEHTLLIDYTNRPQVREQLAQLLGIKKKYIQVQPDEGEAPLNPNDADIILILGVDYREEWRGAGGN
ncbi:MAG: LytR family transcriptional regulator [Herpetosiphonaceae bacterium]|nr:MAG: LytR family transcriptional regulator [Herpetosiphonaceae bacterium]